MNCRLCATETPTEYCNVCQFWRYWIEAGDTHEGNRVARIYKILFVIYPNDTELPLIQGMHVHRLNEQETKGTHVIKFLDGETVTTNALQLVGNIPRRFQPDLPDNAMLLDTRARCKKCRRRFVPLFDELVCMPCIIEIGKR